MPCSIIWKWALLWWYLLVRINNGSLTSLQFTLGLYISRRCMVYGEQMVQYRYRLASSWRYREDVVLRDDYYETIWYLAIAWYLALYFRLAKTPWTAVSRDSTTCSPYMFVLHGLYREQFLSLLLIMHCWMFIYVLCVMYTCIYIYCIQFRDS